MHFSIPDTQEFDSGSSSYTGYNVHINGLYHCTVRYRQLHNLNEQLKRIHDSSNVPNFPPKKFLPLSSNQLEERRCNLEKYIQIVGQTPQLANTDVFTGFLLSAQLESSGEKNREISMDAFLMNGFRITVTCNINESSSQVLEKICRQINLPIPYLYYFALFLVSQDDDGDITIVRKLQDFESPYISQKTIELATRLVIRKSYWDPAYDDELAGDRAALNLIYTQTVSDLERGWILCTRDTQAQLASLQARGAKREYLEIARNLKYYGYTQFQPCTCNYPVPGTTCVVSTGYKELCLRVTLDGGDTREGAFKVTRMKCWRITIHNDTGESSEGENRKRDHNLELSFEYLIAKEQLQWIRIFSDQAILMSVCLQSMVDELLLKKVGAKIKQPSLQAKGCYNYMKRDGSHHQISVSQSSSFDCLTSPTVQPVPSTWDLDRRLQEIDSESPRDLVLQKIKKIDRDISRIEAAIIKLKRKEEEFATTSCTLDNGEESYMQTNKVSLFQKIYEENRKKALKSHLEMEKLGPKVDFPLYNQPCDTSVYHDNIRTHSLFKERLVKHLRDKKKKREAQEEHLAKTYSKQKTKWMMEVEKIENTAERKETLAKYREIYEKEFPELKNHVNRRRRSTDGCESDLQKPEFDVQEMRSRAAIPPFLFDTKQRSFNYIDNNGKVEDFAAEYKMRQMLNIWTEEEKQIFKVKFLQRPKRFHFIASQLNNKSVSECVQYYYHSKKEENYKLLLRNARGSKLSRNCFGKVNIIEAAATSEQMNLILDSTPVMTTRIQQNQLRELDKQSVPIINMVKPSNIVSCNVETRRNDLPHHSRVSADHCSSLTVSATSSSLTTAINNLKPERMKKRKNNGNDINSPSLLSRPVPCSSQTPPITTNIKNLKPGSEIKKKKGFDDSRTLNSLLLKPRDVPGSSQTPLTLPSPTTALRNMVELGSIKKTKEVGNETWNINSPLPLLLVPCSSETSVSLSSVTIAMDNQNPDGIKKNKEGDNETRNIKTLTPLSRVAAVPISCHPLYVTSSSLKAAIKNLKPDSRKKNKEEDANGPNGG